MMPTPTLQVVDGQFLTEERVIHQDLSEERCNAIEAEIVNECDSEPSPLPSLPHLVLVTVIPAEVADKVLDAVCLMNGFDEWCMQQANRGRESVTREEFVQAIIVQGMKEAVRQVELARVNERVNAELAGFTP